MCSHRDPLGYIFGLRLHAGQGDADALESALHAAEELGQEVRRVLEANAESEALLRQTPRS